MMFYILVFCKSIFFFSGSSSLNVKFNSSENVEFKEYNMITWKKLE